MSPKAQYLQSLRLMNVFPDEIRLTSGNVKARATRSSSAIGLLKSNDVRRSVAEGLECDKTSSVGGVSYTTTPEHWYCHSTAAVTRGSGRPVCEPASAPMPYINIAKATRTIPPAQL